MLIQPGQTHVWDSTERDWKPGNVGDIAGDVTISQFNGGLGATNTSFWRGDEVWAVPTAGSIGGITDPGMNGIVVRTGPGVSVARQLTAPAAGFTISNADGTTGNPTFALSDDLAAVEGLTTTGFVRRTALNTWSASAIIIGDLPGGLFVNPTGLIGLSAVNGSANTGIRSDGAPALSQAIVPTWTGFHIFSASLSSPVVIGGSGPASSLTLRSTSGIGNINANIIFQVGTNGSIEAMRILNSEVVVSLPQTNSANLLVTGILKTGTTPVILTNAAGNILISAVNVSTITADRLTKSNGTNLVATSVSDDGIVFSVGISTSVLQVDYTSGVASFGGLNNDGFLCQTGSSYLGDWNGIGNATFMLVDDNVGKIFVSKTIVPLSPTTTEIGGSGNQGFISIYLSNTIGTCTVGLSAPTITSNRTATFPNSNTFIPIISQTLTFTGPTAARTITLPDANITVARTDASNTFTGNQFFIGHIFPNTTNTYDLGSSTSVVRTGYFGTSLITPTLTTLSSGNLTAAPTGNFLFNTTGKQIDPVTGYDQNLGQLSKKYLTLHAAELWVETLVAQDTIATIGGRILVGPTTTLTSDLAAISTSIVVKHNQMINGDRIYMEANGQVEFMAIISAPSGTGPYTYTVTRNLDGTGANAWSAGDAVFNTGQAGNGFIDLYSVRGVKASSQVGPTIVGNVRNSTTYNDWSERWAIGNLNGLYGYGTNIYGVAFGVPTGAWVKIDPTNGVRIGHNTTTFTQIDAAGNASFTGSITAASGTIAGWTINATSISSGTTYLASGFDRPAGQIAWFGKAAAGDQGWTIRDAVGRQISAVVGSGTLYPALSIKDATVFRIVIGGLNTAWGSDGSTDSMGMKIWSSAGAKLVEFSDVQNIIGGWNISTTSISKNEVKIAAGVDAAFVAGTGEAWFGKSATGYYGLMVKGTTAAQVQMAAGNPSIGSAGRPYLGIYDGTRWRIVLGELNTTVWSGADATNSMGMKIWSSTGTKIVEFSDVQNIIAGWTITSTKISSTGIDLNSGASAGLSFGATPPTSASAGTGIWLDRTGLYGLAANVVQAKFDAATGAITAGAGTVKLDAGGISIVEGTAQSNAVTWTASGTRIADVFGDALGNDSLVGLNAISRAAGNAAEGRISSINSTGTVSASFSVVANDASTVGYASFYGTGFRGVCINEGGTKANPPVSTSLEVRSTIGAFLPPRMTTTQRDALTAADGMILYNTTTGALNYRKAGAWVAI